MSTSLSLTNEINELEVALDTLRKTIEAQNKIYQAGKRYLRDLKDKWIYQLAN